MTSTASKPKNYTSLAFKRTFKSSLLNMILALGASGVVVFIAICSTMMQSVYNTAADTQTRVYYTIEVAVTVLIFLTLITGFFSLTIAPKMFKQIYKKQSCDSYFSVPIKREEYFIANYFYGAMVNVLCFVIPLAIYFAALEAITSKYSNNLIDYKIILPVFVALLLAVLAIYSAFVICAVISGKRIQYLVLSLICLICTSTTLVGIATKICSIWGFSGDLSVISALSPVENALASYMDMENDGSNLAVLIIISLVEIIGMFFAGYIAFKNRKAETAEASLSGKVLPYVILAVLASAAFFFSAMGNSVIDIIIGIVLAVLITMAFSGIFYKKVFTKETAITVACVCAICTALSISVMLPVFNSYVKYVPEADEVENVQISQVTSGSYAGVASMLGYEMGYSDYGESVTLVQKENIENVIALHSKSVDDMVIKTARKNSNSSWLRIMLFLDSMYSYDYIADLQYKITYELTDGSTVERVYSVPINLVSKEYYDVIQTEEALWQSDPMNIKNNKFLAVECSKYNEEDYTNDDIELVNFDIEKFNEALVKDYLAMDRIAFINEFETVIYYQDAYVDYETLCDVNIYYANDDITDEELAKYKKMSNSQLLNALYEDWQGNMKTECSFVSITENYVNTVEYLESCGANLK